MTVVETGEITHIVEPYAEIAYSGKLLGNVDWSRFGDPAEAAKNRQKLIDTLNPAKYVLQIVQMGNEFTDLSGMADEDLQETYETDGLFIDRPGVALGLNPADCNAVTMYDGAEGSILGLIHAGRQGATGEIHLSALERILAGGVAASDVRVHFAPSIRRDSYHFTTIDAEQLADPKWAKFIELQSGNYHIDLVGRVVRDLAEVGVDPSQMEVSPIDVGANTDYFSHVRSRRSGEQIGRNGVVAMLRTQEASYE